MTQTPTLYAIATLQGASRSANLVRAAQAENAAHTAAGLPLLDLHIRHKAFAGRTVLREVRLQLQVGEVVSLVGASGCGKSTLLRLIAGLDREHDGDMTLAGVSLTDIHREIGLIFQEPRLLPWLTVAQNVGFGASVRVGGRSRAGESSANKQDTKGDGGDSASVQALLKEVGLAHAADLLPKQLSGGMAQRAAIARGLYTQPRLLLLDEPFSAVDAFTRMRLQDLLLAVARQHGITVLLVTHDIDEAAYLSDRVLVMGQGEMLADLAISDLRPRDRRAEALAVARSRILQVLEDVHVI